MIKLAFATLVAAASLAATPVPARDVVSAPITDVGPFSRIEVNGHADLVLVQGDREEVVVEAPSRGDARVRVRSEDGRLRIDVGDSSSWLTLGPSREPTITVYFKSLESLHTAGAIKATAATIASPTLEIKASGAATLKFDGLKVDDLRFSGAGAVKGEFGGSATTQQITISGAGTYRGAKLASEAATVTVSGAGKVSVNARRTLDAKISGAGAIEYFGDPEVRQRVSGAGKITRRSIGTST